MKNTKLFIKTIGYSLKLVYAASGFSIILYFLLHFIAATLNLVNLFLFKKIIDNLASLPMQGDQVLLWVFIYVLSLVVMQAINSAQTNTYNLIFKKVEHLFDCNLLQKLAELPLSIIDSSAGKDWVDDVRRAKNTAIYTMYRLVRVFSLLYTFVVAFISLAQFDLFVSIVFLLLVIPGVIMSEKFEKKAEKLRRERAPDIRKFSYYRWMLTDAWPAKDVRMYNLTDSIKSRYIEEKERYLFQNKKLDKQKLSYMLLAETIFRSGQIAYVVLVVYRAVEGSISIGDIALYTGLIHNTSNSFQIMLHLLVLGYTQTAEKMPRLFDFFSIDSGQSTGKRELRRFDSLSFENVYFKYPNTNNYVLSGASFSLNRGEILSIVGINGSGKSTIVKLMLGLYTVESGRILINGFPLPEYNIWDVRKMFSVLFQNFVPYPLTLRENIALSDPHNIEDNVRISEVLYKVGLFEKLKPKIEQQGLDFFMTRSFDDSGLELSRGQWQKIALARAYFKDAPIIVFDEPSAALDAEAEDKIFKDLESLSVDKTGIIISHRISSTRISNKIIVLDGGKIIEEGTHNELLLRNGLYAKLYNLQCEKYSL